MKVYIITDLEGATGVFKFSQTRDRQNPAYRDAVRLLMGDIEAVAEGLRQAGATDIWCLDGHGGGDNVIPELMATGVRYVTGCSRGCPVWGLDESFDAVAAVGYHSMNGTPDGVLHHTQSSLSESKYWYDGVERGEIYQCAVLAGHFDIPVILVTGDEAACREARATLGDDLPTVSVKTGIHREAAVLMAPGDTRTLLAEGARRALADLNKRKPYKPQFPVALTIRSLGAAAGLHRGRRGEPGTARGVSVREAGVDQSGQANLQDRL